MSIWESNPWAIVALVAVIVAGLAICEWINKK